MFAGVVDVNNNIIFVSSFHLEQIEVWITGIQFNATTQNLIQSDRSVTYVRERNGSVTPKQLLFF